MQFAFVLFFVFNFFLYQAKTHSFVPRYGETNSPKIFTSDTLPVVAVPNRIKRETLDGYANVESITNIGNGQGKRNFVVVDESSDQGSSDSFRDPNINVGNYPNNMKTGTNRNGPPVNSNRRNYPYNQHESNLGNRYGDRRSEVLDYSNTWGFNHRYPARRITNNNIGNGIGNRNIVSIQNGAYGLDRSDPEPLPPYNRWPTNKNYRKKWNDQSTEIPKNFNQRADGSNSRTYTRIGQGINNNLIVIMDTDSQGSKHTCLDENIPNNPIKDELKVLPNRSRSNY